MSAQDYHFMGNQYGLTLHQKSEIMAILVRCRAVMIEVRDPALKDIHVLAARNGIICYLSGEGWPTEDISPVVNQTSAYVDRVRELKAEDLQRREHERIRNEIKTSS